MFEIFLKSKIHRATVTGTNPDYTGSITLDRKLMDAAGIREHEKVLVCDINNGNRFETYAIAGDGVVEVNGAAAKLAEVGDRVIVMSFCICGEGEEQQPTVVVVDEENMITSR